MLCCVCCFLYVVLFENPQGGAGEHATLTRQTPGCVPTFSGFEVSSTCSHDFLLSIPQPLYAASCSLLLLYSLGGPRALAWYGNLASLSGGISQYP